MSGVRALFICVMLLCAVPANAEIYDDLVRAVKFDDLTAVHDLVRAGVDVNSIEEGRGESILSLACHEQSNKVVRFLLSQPGIRIEQQARNGDTALMAASFVGNTAAVGWLLEAGAEVNRPGWAPLHYAAASGNVETIKLLLDHAAYIDAESPNKTTPLMMAVRSGNIYAVKTLLDEGADLSLKNDSGMDALGFARHYGQKTIEEGLLFRLNK